jgi:hypothetical protein
MVSELHALMHKVDGLLVHLPALASQLVEVLGLYSSAAKFSTRFGASEEVLWWSKSSLVSVERALLRMEDWWKENIKVV